VTRSETAPASGFDPAAVPVYPVMRLETGAGQVTVNGQPVTTRPGQSAMEAAIGLVAARAATANARGVRVLVVDEAGHEFWHVIDADGGVHDLTEEQQRPVSTSRRRQQRLGVMLLAGGLVLVIALVGAVVLVARGSSGAHAAAKPTHTVTVKPSPTATQLPALSVPGWSSVALWGSPAVVSVESQAPAVTLDSSGAVFALLGSSSSSSVAVAQLSASTGKPAWSAKIPGEEVLAGPMVATVADRRVVLAATDSKVSAVDVSNHSVTSWAIPDGADTSAVRLTAAGPVITKSSTTASIVDAKGQLVDRSVPAGATTWWPLKDGKALTVDASGRFWRSASARVAGKPGKLRAPKKRVGAGTVATTGRVLVQQWAAGGNSGSGEVVLVGYSMPGLKPLWTSQPVAAVDSSQTHLFGDWLWTGSQLVNTRDGHVVHLPEGVTVVAVDHGTIWAATDEGALSTYDTGGHRQQAAVTPADTGSDTTQAQQATPVGEVGGRLLVAAAADSGDSQRLFLLPSDGSAAPSSSSSNSSRAPSSTTSKSPASSTRASSAKKSGKAASSKAKVSHSKPSSARRPATSPAEHTSSRSTARSTSKRASS